MQAGKSSYQYTKTNTNRSKSSQGYSTSHAPLIVKDKFQQKEDTRFADKIKELEAEEGQKSHSVQKQQARSHQYGNNRQHDNDTRAHAQDTQRNYKSYSGQQLDPEINKYAKKDHQRKSDDIVIEIDGVVVDTHQAKQRPNAAEQKKYERRPETEERQHNKNFKHSNEHVIEITPAEPQQTKRVAKQKPAQETFDIQISDLPNPKKQGKFVISFDDTKQVKQSNTKNPNYSKKAEAAKDFDIQISKPVKQYQKQEQNKKKTTPKVVVTLEKTTDSSSTADLSTSKHEKRDAKKEPSTQKPVLSYIQPSQPAAVQQAMGGQMFYPYPMGYQQPMYQPQQPMYPPQQHMYPQQQPQYIYVMVPVPATQPDAK